MPGTGMLPNGVPVQPGMMGPGIPQGAPAMPPRPQMPPRMPQNFLAPRPQLTPPVQAMQPGMVPQNGLRQRLAM